MKNCQNCGVELPDFAMFCDECGTPWQDDPQPVHVQPDTKQDGKNNFLLIAVVITLTVVIGLLLIKGFEYLVNIIAIGDKFKISELYRAKIWQCIQSGEVCQKAKQRDYQYKRKGTVKKRHTKILLSPEKR